MSNAITTRSLNLLFLAAALTLSSCWWPVPPPIPSVPPTEVVNVFDDLPPLVSERLIMKPLEEGDEESVLQLFADEDVVRYLIPVDADGLTDVKIGIVNTFFIRLESGRGAPWLIYNRQTEELIGLVGFQYYSERHAYCQFILLISKPEWGKGYGTEASAAALDFAFNRLRVNRVESTIDERNAASIRLHEKLGFTHEGTMRKKHYRVDTYIDILQYGILRSDYLSQF